MTLLVIGSDKVPVTLATYPADLVSDLSLEESAALSRLIKRVEVEGGEAKLFTSTGLPLGQWPGGGELGGGER